MRAKEVLNLLKAVESGKLSTGAAMERIKHLPFEDIGFAKVDHHRSLRQGFAEVIFGKGKTPVQVAEIVHAMLRHKSSQHNVLVTRADTKIFTAVKRISKAAKFHPLSGVITNGRNHEVTVKGTDGVHAGRRGEIRG